MNKSLKDWLSEGESLYNAALAEYEQLQRELEALEGRLAAKKEEVNQIAQVINKPLVESSRRLTAELVGEPDKPAVSSSSATIARALTGRGLGR